MLYTFLGDTFTIVGPIHQIDGMVGMIKQTFQIYGFRDCPCEWEDKGIKAMEFNIGKFFSATVETLLQKSGFQKQEA